MRNRYLQDADSGRATFDVTGPLTSIEQNSVLGTGRFSTDLDNSPGDGDSSFKNVNPSPVVGAYRIANPQRAGSGIEHISAGAEVLHRPIMLFPQVGDSGYHIVR